jgi:hypothetical protein
LEPPGQDGRARKPPATGELEIIEDCRLALRPVDHFLLKLLHSPSTTILEEMSSWLEE